MVDTVAFSLLPEAEFPLSHIFVTMVVRLSREWPRKLKSAATGFSVPDVSLISTEADVEGVLHFSHIMLLHLLQS